jgi:serine/threonine protein kinase
VYILCRDEQTQQLVAIKLISRTAPPWQLEMVEHEVSIMLELGAQHPNIVHPRELLLTASHLGLVQEYVCGGTLKDYLKSNQVNEALACYFFRQIIAAVEYCHKHRVAWRDIKLENALLDTSDPPRVVACDFGVSKRWTRGQMPKMTSFAGEQSRCRLQTSTCILQQQALLQVSLQLRCCTRQLAGRPSSPCGSLHPPASTAPSGSLCHGSSSSTHAG